MKILLQSRGDLFTKPGGDTVQIKKTAEHLKQAGIQAVISTKINEELREFDVVHLFNITRPHETHAQFQWAKKHQKKVVITPIYQNFDEWDQKGRIGMQKYFFKAIKNKNTKELIKTAIRTISGYSSFNAFLNQIKTSYLRQQKEILENVDLIITNTDLGYQQLQKDLQIKNQYAVSHLGIDPNEYNNITDIFHDKYHLKDFVLCVANFASIKNHLSLIKAIKKTPYKLVLVGNPVNHHKKYYQQIKKQVGKNVKITTNLERNEVLSAYKYAKVHALTSWFETCGLANIEAGLLGCNLVSTSRGYAKEYFQDKIEYCDPDDVNSIAAAIEKAYHKKNNDNLANHILKNFTWEKSIDIIINAYIKI